MTEFDVVRFLVSGHVTGKVDYTPNDWVGEKETSNEERSYLIDFTHEVRNSANQRVLCFWDNL